MPFWTLLREKKTFKIIKMQSGAVKFGIAIPQAFHQVPVDVSLIENFLARADSSGYDSVWVQEVIDATLLEPAALLTYAAALTQNLRLGSAVLLSGLRPPLQLAKTLATLDQLSRGRLIVGVGLGSNIQIYPAFGISGEKRVRRFVEGIALMKRLWTEDQVDYDGEFWKIRDERLGPKPIQRPHPPIWFGGSHPNALRRAVQLGNGWIGGRTPTDKFRSHVLAVQQVLDELDRDPADFMIGKRVYIGVESNRARAEKRLNEWFSRVYHRGDIADSAAIFGGEQECVDKIGEVVLAGAKLVILNPIADHMEHLDRLARDILPKISATWQFKNK
jgi:probable F420-dependent oxidoreductase